jgi:hypothetical protein
MQLIIVGDLAARPAVRVLDEHGRDLGSVRRVGRGTLSRQKMNWTLLHVFSILYLLAALPYRAVAAGPIPLRHLLNFNRDWKFVLDDPVGAATPDFDDSKWEAVGLPHSFSIPYFLSPEFYVGYGWYMPSADSRLLPRLSEIQISGVLKAN